MAWTRRALARFAHKHLGRACAVCGAALPPSGPLEMKACPLQRPPARGCKLDNPYVAGTPSAWPCALTARQHTPTNPIRAEPAPSIELPNQDADYVSHIALDIGGTLIKLVYFSPDPPSNGEAQGGGGGQPSQGMPAGASALPPVATTPAGSSITRGGGFGSGDGVGWGGQLGWWIRAACKHDHSSCIEACHMHQSVA